ncbi:HAD family hydrolase [Streptomyces sp. NPDC088725]|uniref:HAD family hydrolase n=1 Tax=Streptomyces sp. NPDC088725 TaxID=3365873 RepID=UPI00380B45E7
MSLPERLVFTDVDETLIRCKSPFDFLRYYHEGRDGPAGARRAEAWTADLTARIAAGLPREKANRAYHRLWRGTPVAETTAWARRWFDERGTAPDFFVDTTLRDLRAHREAGAAVSLVSGSFPPLLHLIAEAVGAAHVLCAVLERCGGTWTGEIIGEPMIGAEKARQIRRLLASRPDVDPADCFAYGDHASDLPMLLEVGHPVVVGDSLAGDSLLGDSLVGGSLLGGSLLGDSLKAEPSPGTAPRSLSAS